MRRSVRLEGFHAVKHALRFGASITSLVTADPEGLERLRSTLAPDLDLVAAGLRTVDDETWRRLAPRGLPSPLLGEAVPPDWTLADVSSGTGPVVCLEQPRHLGNLGAVVRVAAAAAAAGVLVAGEADPLHATVVRAAAGLQWALPVLCVGLDEVTGLAAMSDRQVIAVDERGEDLTAGGGLGDAVLLLGTERHGLTDEARALADRQVRIPMRDGVASLNLATAAAVALYAGSRPREAPWTG